MIISGITPTAEETSIKVEGTGTATITDMTVELVPNPDHFEDAYPSDSEGQEDSDSETSTDSDDELDVVKDLVTKIKNLEISKKDASEERNSALSRLNLLENYGRTLGVSRPDDLEQCIEMYRTERVKAFEAHKAGEIALSDIDQDLARSKKEKNKLIKKSNKSKQATLIVKMKEREKKRRARWSKATEKQRLKKERSKFWPRFVYRVALNLDTNVSMTPSSSRRGSIDSRLKTPMSSSIHEPSTPDATDASYSGSDPCKVSLSVSYITSSASWAPRYDVSMSSPTKSGTIVYRAEFKNTTSETWQDTQVTLSTSQTHFLGLAEAIPQVQPWHIRLAKGFGEFANDNALYSRSEQQNKHNPQGLFQNKPQQSRSSLFGLDKPTKSSRSSNNPFPPPPGSLSSSVFGNPAAPSQAHVPSTGGLFGATGTSSGFSGSNLFQPQQPHSLQAVTQQSFGQVQAQPNIAIPLQRRADTESDELKHDIDETTIVPTDAALSFEESTWEESGLTATYTIPGSRTIVPSYTTRRHKIASIPLSTIDLSHVIVPKLRAAAFLKARLRNTSSTTLLKGPAGLTLDGSFLGNSSIPRSSPGEAFVLNLGADPAINVVYSKPTVRRSQTGVFQKEGSCIYSRSCILTNTKNDAVIQALVTDQIPVSEDDKLKVEVLVPGGLYKEGDVVKAGQGQINEGTGKKGSTYAEKGGVKGEGKWGKATAKLKKEGEVEWDIKLNPGQGVKLELEYEAKFPSGDGIVGV